MCVVVVMVVVVVVMQARHMYMHQADKEYASGYAWYSQKKNGERWSAIGFVYVFQLSISMHKPRRKAKVPFYVAGFFWGWVESKKGEKIFKWVTMEKKGGGYEWCWLLSREKEHHWYKTDNSTIIHRPLRTQNKFRPSFCHVKKTKLLPLSLLKVFFFTYSFLYIPVYTYIYIYIYQKLNRRQVDYISLRIHAKTK